MIGEYMNYIGFIVVSNTLGIDTNHELGNPEKNKWCQGATCRVLNAILGVHRWLLQLVELVAING